MEHLRPGDRGGEPAGPVPGGRGRDLGAAGDAPGESMGRL